MTCSPARLAANRSNSLGSTGPRTAEGKGRSRGNAYKHGMTGEGVARPEAGAVAIEAMLAEVATPMLARRVAVLADRLDRLARHDAVATARRVREAGGTDGGEGRHRELDDLVASLADQPASAVRKLKRSPAGIDRLLGLWDDLARDLGAGRDWGDDHRDLAARLGGRKPGGLGISRVEILSAVEGDGRAEALGEIAALISGEIAALRKLHDSLPPADPARDRSEGVALALFDASKQGDLFRRYELATERNFYKALDQVRKADALDLAEAAMTVRETPPETPRPPLASFGAGPIAEPGPIEAPAPTPVPAPSPSPRKAQPSPASTPGALILPPTLPAGREQDEAFGEERMNFGEVPVTRLDRRAPLLKR